MISVLVISAINKDVIANINIFIKLFCQLVKNYLSLRSNFPEGSKSLPRGKGFRKGVTWMKKVRGELEQL